MRHIVFLVWSMISLSGAYAQQQTTGQKISESDFLISAEEFHNKISTLDNPQILDSRSLEEYELSHLPNAKQIDGAQVDRGDLLNNLDKTKPTFIYSIRSGRSSQLAKVLLKHGFEEVYVLYPGISAWIGAGYPIEVSDKNTAGIDLSKFRNLLVSNETVLVNYSSDYCATCRKVLPILDSLTSDAKQKIEVIKIDIDHNPHIIKEFEVRALPTLVLYKEGNPVWKKEGLPTLAEIQQQLEK